MAAFRRNPKGWADGLRRAALLVVAVLPFPKVMSPPRALHGLPLKPSAATLGFRDGLYSFGSSRLATL